MHTLAVQECTRFVRAGQFSNLIRVRLPREAAWLLVPVIAPYAATRDEVRAHHDAHGTGYLEVHVATPLDECSRRDVKGLYARAAAGELTGMTGVDDPYEEPDKPDLRLDTTGMDVAAAARSVLDLLIERGVA